VDAILNKPFQLDDPAASDGPAPGLNKKRAATEPGTAPQHSPAARLLPSRGFAQACFFAQIAGFRYGVNTPYTEGSGVQPGTPGNARGSVSVLSGFARRPSEAMLCCSRKTGTESAAVAPPQPVPFVGRGLPDSLANG